MLSNQDLPLPIQRDPRPRAFRADIQGLRAIAVGIVVLYHFWGHYLPGGFVGVDVFFVISGFLITSHLISKPPKNVADVGRFWMRRVKRLIPASFVVILCSVVGIWLIAPTTVWQDWGLQAIAATFYFQNWFLALTKVDYLAEGDAVSPFQHFWSLSAEEQFYFVWPILIGALVIVALRFQRKPGTMALAGVGTVFAVSLGYSIYATATDPGSAYFSTFTRAWEFSAGALVAALGTKIHAAKKDWVSLVGAWGGVLALAFSALAFSGEMPFPGYIAAVPVLGTALLLLSHSTHKYSPNIFLNTRIFQFFGDNSYAIYLWHWPLLILMPYLVDDFGWPQKIIALALTLVLAVLTQKLVEVRFRKFIDTSALLSAPRFLAAGSLVLALVAGSFYLTSTRIIRNAENVDAALASVQKELGEDCFGPEGLSDSCDDPQTLQTSYESAAPAPVVAKEDKPRVYADDCFSGAGTDFATRPVCNYGHGKIKVALVGNSHAGQWFPAIDKVAKAHGWSLDTYLASRCAVLDAPQEFESEEDVQGCNDYARWATKQFEKEDYDLIISSNRFAQPLAGRTLAESEAPGRDAYEEMLQDWSDTGAEVAVIRDTPWPGSTVGNIPDCVAANSSDYKDCSAAADEWIPMDPQAEAVKALDDPDVVNIDMNDQLCDDTTCYPVVGGVMAYWDHSHLSETYVQMLAKTVDSRLQKAIDSKELFPGSSS
ncbi:acyltransferase [Glutamicibacter halophytocola]|uniref:Acyltransferase n=1 Tax=Glutamicibacter halophytocola TaxID=1933880 RepID=A0ABX5Y5P3_9MICC|nr:acyltransferase family protein [Glutamicibacter halophytocola]MBF6671470.1 acyltransferase [Glutamicibacter sp. FBE19]QDY65122.1 acyltransferase [Glutamicibacter halophytocola]